METYRQQLRTLINNGLKELSDLIDSKGVESENIQSKCLKIEDDDYAFNLEGGRYLVEVANEQLIDNSGHQYGFSSIDTEDLLSVIDHLIEKYK